MRRLFFALALVSCTEPALAQYGGGGYSPGGGGGGSGDMLGANNLSDVSNAATSLANLGTLPAFRVCPTCAYTTIASAITAATAAGGGVVKVAPGSYTEAVTAAAGVHLLCDVPSAQVKACRITGTAGNPAITYDIGTPGGAREDHVSLARGFLLVSGGGVGVPAVSVECPVAAAQRVELYEVDLFTASGSGQALRMTCGATGSGGLETVARIHGEMTQINSQGGSTESVVYHSGGWLDFRGYIAIDADSGDDVALEVAAAGTGTVTVADFLLTGTVQVGAAATTAVTLGQGVIATATAAPIVTNGAGALSIGVVGLWAVAAAPAACVAGAGVVVHAPTSLNNVGNCGTLIAATVNGGAGPDFAGTFAASRLQQELLGTAALLDVGTGASNVVQLDGSSRLPAVDGSQLTNLPSSGDLLAANNLSDVSNAATSLANLNGQTQGDALDDWNTLGACVGASEVPVCTGAGTYAYQDAATFRGTVGLGSAAVEDVGTGASNVVQLDGSSRLPAVDGSQLTNLPAASVTTCIEPAVTPDYVWDPSALDAQDWIAQGRVPTFAIGGGRCGVGMWDTNGSTDYFQLAAATWGAPASWTVVLAYQLQNSANDHWILGAAQAPYGNDDLSGALRYTGSGGIRVYHGNPTTGAFSHDSVASAVTQDEWIIIAYRYSDGDTDHDIWLDGVKQTPSNTTSGSPTSAGATTRAFSIGRAGTYTGDTAEANIGAVYMWQSALTDGQVEAASALLETAFGI